MLGFFSTLGCTLPSEAAPGVQTPTPTATGHVQATAAVLGQPAMTCSYSARRGRGEVGMPTAPQRCPTASGRATWLCGAVQAVPATGTRC